MKPGSGRLNRLKCWLLDHQLVEIGRRSFTVPPPIKTRQPYRDPAPRLPSAYFTQEIVLHWISRIDLVHRRCARCGEERVFEDPYYAPEPIRYTQIVEIVNA